MVKFITAIHQKNNNNPQPLKGCKKFMKLPSRGVFFVSFNYYSPYRGGRGLYA
jgi:hypothetical protein